jgi:hypothetical protein
MNEEAAEMDVVAVSDFADWYRHLEVCAREIGVSTHDFYHSVARGQKARARRVVEERRMDEFAGMVGGVMRGR